MAEKIEDPIKILVVDDDDILRKLYHHILSPPISIDPYHTEQDSKDKRSMQSGDDSTEMLKVPNYELSLCESGEKALEAVLAAKTKGQQFCMAFVDVRMPLGRDGIWTAEKIRKISPYTQIVIVTGFNDLELQEIGKRVPPPDRLLYLQKPFHPFEIRQFASTLAARWKAEKMMHAMNQNLESIVAKRTAELQKAYKQLEYQASHDSLTDLLNRRAIFEILNREISRIQRTNESISVILADIDHFKNINDSHGHNIGDAVLVETAKRLMDSVRPYDSVGRIGGEEFLIVLPECKSQDVMVVAERIRSTIGGDVIQVSEKSCFITISIGVATASAKHRIEQNSLITAADEALYKAKRDGRNKIKVNSKIGLSSYTV